MSLLNLHQVDIQNNPCNYSDPFIFNITFEVISELKEDVEFKIVYVGSSQGPNFDQTLEAVMVGPLPVGISSFTLEAPAPNPEMIPTTDIVGLTVMLLTCSYREKEFIRVGYYVNNDYIDPELIENPPDKPDLTKIQRSILAEKPRVTRFAIPWDDAIAIAVSPVTQIVEEVNNIKMPPSEMDSNDAAMEA